MSLSKLKPDSCFSAKITPIYDVFIKKPERARLCEFETHVPPPRILVLASKPLLCSPPKFAYSCYTVTQLSGQTNNTIAS